MANEVSNLMSMLAPGKQVADAAIGIGKGIVEILQQAGVVGLGEEQKAKLNSAVQDGLIKWNGQLIEVYKLETADLQSARQSQTSVLMDAPKWIKAVAAVVVPYGGLMALTIFFGNIIIPWIATLTGYPFQRINLTEHEAFTIDGIIAFFFGYRFMQKIKGTAGKW